MKKNKSISQKIKEISKKHGLQIAPPDHPVFKPGKIKKVKRKN